MTDGRLNVFVGLRANISCLEDQGCWSSTRLKDAGCDDADADLCGCWQSLLAVAVLPSELIVQLVWRVTVYPVS